MKMSCRRPILNVRGLSIELRFSTMCIDLSMHVKSCVQCTSKSGADLGGGVVGLQPPQTFALYCQPARACAYVRTYVDIDLGWVFFVFF